MLSRIQMGIAALLAGALLAAAAPAAHAAVKFGVAEGSFEAGTCVNTTCTYKSVSEHPAEAFTQAAGHPPWGLTIFEMAQEGGKPAGSPLRRVRVDVPPGLAADPQAPTKCSREAFEELEVGGKKLKCPASSEVGTNELTVYLLGAKKAEGKVYDLEPPPGLPLDFGIHVNKVEGLEGLINEYVFLEGHVSWAREKVLEERGIPSGDYHEYFEINNVSGEASKAETTPVLRSQLNFNGRAGGNFLTLPSKCSDTTTSYLEVESWAGDKAYERTQTPVGVSGCEKPPFEPPFAPTAGVSGETQADAPDGASVEVDVEQHAGEAETNSADVDDAHVTLPEGMTLNPSAAHGLQACTAEEIGIGGAAPVSCPAASKIGTVEIETDLPPHALKGDVYLGDPGGGSITGPPYTIYVDAEAPAFGVSVRLAGTVTPDPGTGRLETTFDENPQLPFSQFLLKLNGGAHAPLANPLSCEPAPLEALFTPYTGGATWVSASSFVSTGCASPLPFSLGASAAHAPEQAGAPTAYTFSLAREDGQQYLSQVSTTLPSGLVGDIPAVEQCGEPQAAAGTCSAGSRIGTATVAAGAGADPYTFSGPVFLTGPYGGAPFGLSVAVPAVAGPFDLGTVVTRASISVDPSTARVTVASTLPRIVGGVPLRIRWITVAVERSGFLLNPTTCAGEATEATLVSTLGASQGISIPFASSGCGTLGFAPAFSASTDAHATKADGMSLHTTVAQGAGQSNIRTVAVQLPSQAATRLTTLQKACPEATFAASPSGCPAASQVGAAVAVTPVLPEAMSGRTYLVSHGGAAFPDLDLVLEGSGVRVVLVGNTNISGGVTTTTFAALPDVPVSSFSLDLPTGPYSLLTANTDLCASPLMMPTTLVAQNGAILHQSTRVAVSGCANASGSSRAHGGVRILSRRIRRHTLVLVVRTSLGGRLSVRGRYLRTVSRHLKAAAKVTIKVPLARRGVKALRSHRRLRVRARVRLVPAQHGIAASAASTTVTFRH